MYLLAFRAVDAGCVRPQCVATVFLGRLMGLLKLPVLGRAGEEGEGWSFTNAARCSMRCEGRLKGTEYRLP